jgi:hypothetical protein
MVVTDTVEPPADRKGRPSQEECRAALVRVTESARFKAAPRLASFLCFVVEATLSGEAGRLKAYTIAVGALGRADDFDPTADPIVRVEAGRLRTALARYYDSGGSADPVRIEVPRGRYVPEFFWHQAIVAPQMPDMVADLLTLNSVRQRHSLLHAQHREQREALLRNLEIFKVNMRALQVAADAFRGGKSRSLVRQTRRRDDV